MEPNVSNIPPHCIDMAMEVHKVVPPPHRSTLQKLKTRLKETFFPDDPLRYFKGQPLRKKWILGAQYIFPILEWGPNYNLKLFKSDIVSGLTIASLAIPQGISYAKLANLPPIVGLCEYFSLPCVYAHATLIGFMAGAAIIVSLQQLKSLLGIIHFTKQMGLVPVLSSVFHNTNEWSWQTILMGVCFLVLLLLARHVSMKKPKLFWVSAGAPLASVILSTLLVFAFKAQHHGISVIGKLQEGLNPPSWNMLHFHGSHLGLVIKTGLVTGIISLTEGIAVGRTFAALKNYKVDGNKEMMAIGLMNMVGSSTSCYVTTGSVHLPLLI
ncbi:hypothetical protein L1049_006033 [Liquidambar formosana]|uniref:SLC26A/SulP transporter domain-containing protein n=1 Tax=Liquidambar formosana TaxID=63359 RepID=A0AAP0RER8_LIQFO